MGVYDSDIEEFENAVVKFSTDSINAAFTFRRIHWLRILLIRHVIAFCDNSAQRIPLSTDEIAAFSLSLLQINYIKHKSAIPKDIGNQWLRMLASDSIESALAIISNDRSSDLVPNQSKSNFGIEVPSMSDAKTWVVEGTRDRPGLFSVVGKQKSLLHLLWQANGRDIRTEELCDVIWKEEEPQLLTTLRNRLNNLIFHLNAKLQPHNLTLRYLADSDSYQMCGLSASSEQQDE